MKGLKKLKLPNKYGSVYKLSGKRRKPWTVRKTVGWKLISKKQKAYPIYEFIGYYATKSEVLQALAEYNTNPYDLKNNTITFAEVYEKWSNIHFEKVSHSNVNGYKASYKLCDSIKNMKFVEIKLDHLQKIVDTSGKNVPILKKLKVMLGLVYEYAVIHEIVLPDKREMIRYLDISKAGNPNAYNRKPFTDNEIQVLWDNKDSNIYITVILILIYTGCRISELLNLKKEDIHIAERWFYIKYAKTKSGIREVPIAEKIIPFFEYWLSRNCDFIICTPENEHFSYRNYYDSYWTPIINALNIQKHRPHDTRQLKVKHKTKILLSFLQKIFYFPFNLYAVFFKNINFINKEVY